MDRIRIRGHQHVDLHDGAPQPRRAARVCQNIVPEESGENKIEKRRARGRCKVRRHGRIRPARGARRIRGLTSRTRHTARVTDAAARPSDRFATGSNTPPDKALLCIQRHRGSWLMSQRRAFYRRATSSAVAQKAHRLAAIGIVLRHSGHSFVVGSGGASPRRTRAMIAFTGTITKK